MDLLQNRIEALFEEVRRGSRSIPHNCPQHSSHSRPLYSPDPLQKILLTSNVTDTSVASILMSLGSGESADSCVDTSNVPAQPAGARSKALIAATIQKLHSQVAAELSDEEDTEQDVDVEAQRKSKVGYSPGDLEKIRRERNRVHARKTRQRKKKLLFEMEAIVKTLEAEVSELRRSHSGSSGGPGVVDEKNVLVNSLLDCASGVGSKRKYTTLDGSTVSQSAAGSSSSGKNAKVLATGTGPDTSSVSSPKGSARSTGKAATVGSTESCASSTSSSDYGDSDHITGGDNETSMVRKGATGLPRITSQATIAGLLGLAQVKQHRDAAYDAKKMLSVVSSSSGSNDSGSGGEGRDHGSASGSAEGGYASSNSADSSNRHSPESF